MKKKSQQKKTVVPQPKKLGRKNVKAKPVYLSSVPLYPIRFKEIFRKKVWGGPGLSKILKKKCPSTTGESWEISEFPKNVSVFSNGSFKRKNLTELLNLYRKEILGDEQYMRFHKKFPLLVKFLAAHERLSLQVHPSDDFAARYEVSSSGKMEAWYVLHAPKGSRVIRGVLPGTTIGEFREHLAKGTIEECLNVMEVEPGDVIFIPPGTIHTAYGGVVLLEVQQTSDTTYRLSDWGRKETNGEKRKLDVEKAMSVTDFYSMGVSKFKPFRIPGYSYRRKLLIKCEKFTMESIEISAKRIKEHSDPTRFQIMTVTKGSGRFNFGNKKKQSQPFKIGETYLIPAHLGAYDISARGGVEIIVTYVE